MLISRLIFKIDGLNIFCEDFSNQCGSILKFSFLSYLSVVPLGHLISSVVISERSLTGKNVLLH